MKVNELLTEEKEPEQKVPTGFAPTDKKNEYAAGRKGDRLAGVQSFFIKLGWKRTDALAPGETRKNWGAAVVKMKAPTPGTRIEIVYDQHHNRTYIRFFTRATKKAT
ncbi:hypothetical protein [Acinetobacter sp.]|uniref:hypothetical protein n=1 Tax=Acinetobacter sp. TaxID=472 RepID=UPI00388E8EA5